MKAARAVFHQLLAFQINRPWTALLLFTLVTLGFGGGIPRLEFDFTPQSVYDGEHGLVEFAEQHKKLFGYEDSLELIVLEATDLPDTLTIECLEWLRRISARVEAVDGVVTVTSLATVRRPIVRLREGGNVEWVSIIGEGTPRPEYIRDRLERLALLDDTLISRDRKLLVALVRLDPSRRRIGPTELMVEGIQRALDETPPPAGTRAILTGVPSLRVEIVDGMIGEQYYMFPLCTASFVLVMTLMFRSFRVTLVSLLTVGGGLMVTLGMLGYSGQTFTILSNAIPSLVLVIAAANVLHIVNRCDVLIQEGHDLAESVRLTMREMSRTCLLTLTTTAIGFGSLLVARSSLLQSLGLQAMYGMACNYVALMLLLPPGLMLAGRVLVRRHSRRLAEESGADGSAEGSAEGQAVSATANRSTVPELPGWAAIPVKFPKSIIVFHIVLVLAALWYGIQTPINSYMFETYDPDHPTMTVMRMLDERLAGIAPMEVQLRAPAHDVFYDPDVVMGVRAATKELLARDDVYFARDYTDVLDAFQRIRDDDSRAELADQFARTQRMLQRFDEERMTDAFIAENEPAARMLLRVKDVGSAGLLKLSDAVAESLRMHLPPDRGVTFQLTGDAYLHAVAMDGFVRDLFYSLLAASAIIFLLIAVLFRSLRIGLIATIPNLMPLILTLGYISLRGYELTAGNVIVFAIGLGIAVDDTIHFLARFREEWPTADSAESACKDTLRDSGRAIVLTSVLIISGLSVLLFSSFLPSRRFAELTTITMLGALPGDVVLLPALLCVFSRKKRQPGAADE